MEDDEETFVSIGTPLEFVDEDEPVKKPPKELQAVGVGTKSRPRFHGAFTGGFSAGYFNTVGSKDGFTPSTFTSSKEKKNDFTTQRPEDFMDEEDFAEHGIAPKKFQTSETFTSEDRKRQRNQAIKSATVDTLLGPTTALADLIIPEKLTIGVKLLRKMGWKDGQGVGPRYERKTKSAKVSKDSQKKVYGCSLYPEDSEDSSDELPDNVTFAPRDVNPIKIGAKDNVHGIGYRGLDPRKALQGSSHVNLLPAPAITKKGKRGIRGTAFGVGALEQDDDDIYAQDHMSNYDMTMELDEDIHMGWTAPGRGKKHDVPVGYVGNLLEGFTLSGKKLPPRKIFPPPHLPRDYKPVHTFRRVDTDQGRHTVTKQDAVSRGLTLGETPIFESVFDLIPQKDKERLKTATSHTATSHTEITATSHTATSHTEITEHQGVGVQTPAKDIAGGSSSNSNRQTDHSVQSLSTTATGDWGQTDHSVQSLSTTAAWDRGQTDHSVQSLSTTATEDRGRALHSSPSTSVGQPTKPINLQAFQTGKGAVFSPFIKDPEKQRRYDRYTSLVKEGKSDAYEKAAEGHMTEWEQEREKEEFDKAAKFYKPMTSMMASRFTRAKYHDDDHVEMPAKEEKGDKNDRHSAAKMKMFGPLTHDTYEWHPDRLVCKRFNIPDPYPGSTITGVPKVKRDKYSVYNFLNFSSNEPEEQRSTPERSEIPALPAPEDAKQDRPESISFTINKKSQPKLATSIFSSLNEDKPQTLSTEPVNKEEESRPSMDLFEAIFGNTDSEQSDEEEQDKTVQQMDIEKEESENLDTNQTKNYQLVSEMSRPSQGSVESIDRVRGESTQPTAGPSTAKSTAGPSTPSAKSTGGTSIATPTAGTSTPSAKPTAGTSTPPTKSIFSHLFQKSEKDEANLLPGAPVAIETLEKRLSAGRETEDDSFGPELPPSMKDRSCGPSSEKRKVASSHRNSGDERRREEKDRERDRHKYREERHRERDKYRDREKDGYRESHRQRTKERHQHTSSEREGESRRHSHKKQTKSKKSKHKKKHKKEKKSHRRDRHSSDSSSDGDTESDTEVTNQELLQKLRSLSRSGKL